MTFTPVWGTEIAWYLFLAGLGAGAYAFSVFVQHFYPEAVKTRKFARFAAPIVVIVGLVLLMVDGTEGTTPDTWALLSELGPERTILVWNKSDLATPPPHWHGKRTNLSVKPAAHAVISARKGEGLETLAEAVRELALARSQGQEPGPGEAVPNLRQARSLTEVRGEFEALEQDVLAGVPYDLCAVRLEGAASALAEITGLDTPEEVLNRIFASFCIGK